MKNVDPRLIVYTPKSIKEVETQTGKPFSAFTIFRNLFNNVCNKRFERGTTLDNNRMFSKIMDKIDDAADKDTPIEFSEEQFKFVLDTLENTEVPPNVYLPVIVDFLIDEVKHKQKENS